MPEVIGYPGECVIDTDELTCLPMESPLQRTVSVLGEEACVSVDTALADAGDGEQGKQIGGYRPYRLPLIAAKPQRRIQNEGFSCFWRLVP